MAYHTLPSRDLVFASTPTSSSSTKQPSAEDLILSPDATINQAMIEYEDWLQNSISALRGPLKKMKGEMRKDLIEKISHETEDLCAAKREEWLRQLAVICSQKPLPSFVADNQTPIVDGGRSPFLMSLARDILKARTALQGNFSMLGNTRMPLCFAVA